MAYCKFCGMESKRPDKCDWCGRSLAPEPGRPPEIVPTTAQRIQEEEEAGRKSRATFYISNIVLLVIAAIILVINKGLYPVVILGGLFISGFLMGYLRVIPSFEGEWLEIGIPFILIFFLPAFFVCLGYIAYGLIYRSMDFTVIWLLGTYVVMLTALEAIIFIAYAKGLPPMFFLKIHGSEVLGFAAIGVGWISASSFGLANR
jgi:hypothetical protein